MFPKLKFSYFSVNSEANARRIAMVESCFGSSGQVMLIPFHLMSGLTLISSIYRPAPMDTRSSLGGRRSVDQNVPKETEGSTVFPLQRYTGLWKYCHQ